MEILQPRIAWSSRSLRRRIGVFQFFGWVLSGSLLAAYEVVFESSRRSTLQGFAMTRGFCSGVSVSAGERADKITDSKIIFGKFAKVLLAQSGRFEHRARISLHSCLFGKIVVQMP